MPKNPIRWSKSSVNKLYRWFIQKKTMMFSRKVPQHVADHVAAKINLLGDSLCKNDDVSSSYNDLMKKNNFNQKGWLNFLSFRPQDEKLHVQVRWGRLTNSPWIFHNRPPERREFISSVGLVSDIFPLKVGGEDAGFVCYQQLEKHMSSWTIRREWRYCE